MATIIYIPEPGEQLGMLLEQADAVDKEIDKHYVSIGELTNVKLKIHAKIQALSTQCVEPSATVFTLADYKRQVAERQVELKALD